MDRYIEQLLEDLNKITSQINSGSEEDTESENDDESFFKHIESVENYLYGEKLPVSDITGISHEQLPPPEKLTKSQQKILAEALENFLGFFHFELDFPRKYPVHLRYPFIRNFWKEKHASLTFGSNHIEFCDYEKENCPFPGYCKSCDEAEEQIKADNEQTKNNSSDLDMNELPF